MEKRNIKRNSNKRGGCRRFLRIIEFGFYASAFICALVFSALALLFFIYSKDLPSLNSLDFYSPSSGNTPDSKWSQATQILARDGSVIGEFYEEDRVILEIEKTPDVMKKAIIAVEDERFDKNHPTAWIRRCGIDPIGIIRASIKNFITRRTVQGGSTITQQLAKNLFLTRERTLKRKIQEIILAYKIEANYTRDEILERYLNKVFFGNHAYGVASAASRYYGIDLRKSGSTLTLGQAAMLAGLAKAPTAYAPHKYPDRAKARQKIVLQRMVDCGYISESDIDSAIEVFRKDFDPKKVNVPENDSATFELKVTQAGYFLEYVRQELLKIYTDDQIKRGGLIVHTTLDPRMQTLAEAAVSRGLLELTKEVKANRVSLAKGPLESALLCINHKTGEILAMVGGSSWGENNQFNRAVQAKRQVGSAFKPLVYYTALSETATLATVIRDEPITIDGWTPHNYDARYHGPVLPRTAIAHSYNVSAVQMLLIAGIQNVINTIGKDFGIDNSKMQPYPSLALGAFEVSLLEMTSAYSAWANGGIRYTPYPIEFVEDRIGTSKTPFISSNNEISKPEVYYLMTSILQSVVRNGTAASSVGRVIGNIPAAGKTGTTDDYADAWFIGYTPTVTCGVWVGFDERRTMGRGMTGGRAAGRIWANFIKSVFKDTKPGSFPNPSLKNISSVSICALSGLGPSPDCIDNITELFLPGTAPTDICSIHSDPSRLQEFLYGASAASDTEVSLWPDQVNIGAQQKPLSAERQALMELIDAEAGPSPVRRDSPSIPIQHNAF